MNDKIQTSPIDSPRRRFVGSGAAAVAAVMTAAVSGPALATGHAGHGMPGSPEAGGVRFTGSEKACATCVFWGGSRKAEKGSVLASSLGTCNNPASPNFQKMTSPDHVMPQWVKWPALG
jgi:hypothetical protein